MSDKRPYEPPAMKELNFSDPFDDPARWIKDLERVCDGHPESGCDSACYIAALEAEVHKLRKERDFYYAEHGDVFQLTKSKELLESKLRDADTQLAVLEKKVNGFRTLGWNEARAAKCRMLENWQVRFINIMAQVKGGHLERNDLFETYERLAILMREMKWAE